MDEPPARAAGHRFAHVGEVPGAVEQGQVFLTYDQLRAPGWRPPRAIDTAPRPALEDCLGDAARAAQGREVVLEGYVVPLDGRGVGSRTWMLAAGPEGCCAGRVPEFDEWVRVELAAGEGWDGDPFAPVRVVGRFEAGEVRGDFGFLECVYRLREARQVPPPLGPLDARLGS